MKKKTILALVLALFLLFSSIGCQSAETPQNTDKDKPAPESTRQTQPESTAPLPETTEFFPETTEFIPETTESLPETTEGLPETTELPTEATEPTVEEPLDLMQRNSVVMLNYLAMITQKINSAKNNRLFLEEAYSTLINNTNPETVDAQTMEQLGLLLDTINSHRMHSLQRERTQFLLEQQKAAAMVGAVKSSVNVLTNLTDVMSVVENAESLASLGIASAESDYLQAVWQLDDDEAQTIHETRKAAFTYRIGIVQEYQLPKELALKEEDIDNFVEWSQNPNNDRKIQYYESKEAFYRSFGPYWLELADCYYRNREYKKCLDAIEKYNELNSTVFLKDHDYAKTLPRVIIAAQNVYDGEAYVSFTENALSALLDNTSIEDWDLRYIAAQAYMDLYSRTRRPEYLQDAYKIVLDNVNILASEQKRMNDIYLNDVVEIQEPTAETSDAKKQRKAYNEAQKEKRKTELPPVYEPLMINCDLLFALTKEPDVGEIDKAKIERILSDSGRHTFMSEYYCKKFSFAYTSSACKGEFLEDELVIPVIFLTENTTIRVSVTEPESGRTDLYYDWTVESVERNGHSVESFMARLKSEKISDQEWTDDSRVTVDILEGDSSTPLATMVFEVEDSSNWILWKDYTFVQVQ